MRAQKHAAVCAWCREAKRSRYRAIVDAYLCETCHHGVQAQRAEHVSVGPMRLDAVQVMARAQDAAELEQFDLSHLEGR